MHLRTLSDEDVKTRSPAAMGDSAPSMSSPAAWAPGPASATLLAAVLSSLKVLTGSVPSAKSSAFLETRSSNLSPPRASTPPPSALMACLSTGTWSPSSGRECQSSLSRIIFRASMFCLWYASKNLAHVLATCFLRLATSPSQKASPQEMKQWVHSRTCKKCSPSPAEGALSSEAMRPSTCSKRSLLPSFRALLITPITSIASPLVSSSTSPPSLAPSPLPSLPSIPPWYFFSSSAYHRLIS
mmetsp:Transcript_9143/g.31515  ORF Transcript_9143/g.31515 Transcript_9143/m.31515 type:complete len:242 (-) Transcript_9143:1107-1832(-)